MNAEEATRLCAFAKSACPQQAIDQDTPAAWFVLLNDLRYDDAMEALVNVVRTQPFVSPAEIRAEVKKIRSRRIDAFGHLPNPPAEVGADPKAYQAWMKDAKRRIADGEVTRPDQLATEPLGTGRPRPLELEHVFRHVNEVEPVEGEDAEPEVVQVEVEDAGAQESVSG